MNIVFCFSGQGSHFYQMGRDLYHQDDIFRHWLDTLDRRARELIGISVVDEIYGHKLTDSLNFHRTLYTHPAIFMVEYATAMTLIGRGIQPDMVLGTSLGEFTAVAVAGSISPEKALECVIAQARILEEVSEAGGMMAVLHDPGIYKETPLFYDHSVLAGVNYHSHFVVSGSQRNLDDLESFLKAKGITYFRLPVSIPFHSALIDGGRESFLKTIGGNLFQKPQIPVISCCFKREMESFPESYFWDVVREPIEFKSTVEALEAREPHIYIDAGPSGTLVTFLRQFISGGKSEFYVTLNQFGRDLNNFEKLDHLKNRAVQKSGRTKEMKMKAYVFAGQGAQKKGMGGDLFDKYPDLTAKADEVLGYSIKQLCLEDPDNNLGQTHFTQPALYTVGVLSYLDTLEKEGKPDFTAGHSLGEYAALFAGGVFDFETGLKLVKERGRLMSQATGGGMAAVLGLQDDKVREILEKYGYDTIDVANFNSPGQVVISGIKEDIQRAQSAFESEGAARYVVLAVSGAFHSRYMENARKEFENFIDQFQFRAPEIPVLSNVTARPHRLKSLKRHMADQIVSSVKWTESIRYLMGKEVSEYKEIGGTFVVGGMIAKIRKESAPLIVTDEEASDEPVVAESSGEAPAAKAPVNVAMTASSLGSQEFKKDYNLKYAYITGAMYKGIASKEIVIKMGKAGLMGFLGTGGMNLNWVEENIKAIQSALTGGESFGMNLLNNIVDPDVEEKTVDLYLKYGIKVVEAAAYMQVSAPLVRYRLTGLKAGPGGTVVTGHKIIAKVSRPEVAASFLEPAPEKLVNKLLEAGKITREQAELSAKVPMADDICVEADSGGHTDMGVAYTLMPGITRLRDDMMAKYGYAKKVRIGAAGGIGTPQAAAAALILGADFLVTGSINQCTVEAGISDVVKDMLQQINVQDTEYAPAGDMFELGARVQVMRKGVFFPARANKLYSLYTQHNSLDEIDPKTRQQLEEKYFKRSFNDIWEGTKAYFSKVDPRQVEKGEKSPKHKMALVFRWYFGMATKWANDGEVDRKVDFQVQCGPALGAFNQWIKGSSLEDWRNRHVDQLAEKLMEATASLLNERFAALTS